MRFDSNIRHRTSIRRSQQKYLKLFTTLNDLSKFDLANPSDLELVVLLNFDPPDLPNSSDPADLPVPPDLPDPPEPSDPPDPADLPDLADPLIHLILLIFLNPLILLNPLIRLNLLIRLNPLILLNPLNP